MVKEYMPEARNSSQDELVLPKAFYDLGAQPAPVPPQQQQSSPQQEGILPLEFYTLNQIGGETLEYGIIPSVKRGAANTFASLSNLVGQEEWKVEAQKYAAQFPKEIPDIQSVKTLSDLGTFAVESAAENVANLLLLGVGSAFGAAAGAPLVGLGVTNLALQAGESKMTIEDSGADPDLVNVGLPALANTAIDTFSFLKIAQKANVLGKVMKVMDEAQEVSGVAGRVKKGLETGAFALVSEGSTEAIQTYNNMVASKLANDQEFKDAVTLQGHDADELINAFAAGGLGAAVTAGPAGAVFTKSPTNESAVREPRAAPVQDTEVDRDPLTGQDAQRVNPGEPDADTPPVEDTPVETQAAGNPSEPSEVQDTPLSTVEGLKAEVDLLRDFLINDTPISPLETRRFGRFQLPESKQLSVSDLPDSPNQFTVDLAAMPMIKLDGTESELLNAVALETPSTVRSYGFAREMPTEARDNLVDLVESLRSQFMPDAPVMLIDSETMDLDGANGAMAPFEFQGKRSYAIAIDSSFYYNKELAKQPDTPKGRKDAWENTYAYIAETVAHEMGHAVAQENFVTQDTAVKNAVYLEYQNWLDHVKTMTIKEFIESRFANQKARFYLERIPAEIHNKNFIQNAGKMLGWKSKQLRYHLSFEEFTADNMAKFVQKDKRIKMELSPETRGFWKTVYEGFKAAWEFLGKRLSSTPKFTAFMQMVRQQNALNALSEMPLASTSIQKEVAEVFDGDFSKFKESLNLPFEGAIRFLDQADTIMDDANHLEALKENYRVSTGFSRRIKGKLLTPSQIAERYNIPEAKLYMERVYDFHNTKMRGIGKADAVAQRWMRMPQKKADDFSRFIFEVSELSDEKARRLLPREIESLREKHNVDSDMYDLYTEMEGTFSEILDRLERALIQDVARQYTTNAEGFVDAYLNSTDPLAQATVIASYDITDVTEILTKLKNIRESFSSMRDRNYFPRMRFGSYTLTVKKNSMKNQRRVSEVLEFMTFETEKEQQAMLKEYESQYKKERDAGEISITASVLDDTSRALYGMPQVVIDKIATTLRDKKYGPGLTPDQEKALTDISLDLSPGRRYLRHMQKRKNTAGFSTDAMRTYAAYMGNASNHLARVEHTQSLTEALRALDRVQKDYQGTTNDLAELSSYYTDHFKYLLNPENDWAKLRAFGFLWYLGFNVKSALVNTTQLPMVTYPYLAARYGDGMSVSNIGKAMKDVVQHFMSKKPYTEAEQRLMDRLLQEGVIDESMASDLAGLSEGTALQRVLPTNKAHRVINDINHYGGYLFSVAEKYNRQVTALATFRMHMKKTGDFEESFRASKDAIHKSQFEYAKYNRPEFMRGKKAAFFLFYNYTQQFMYLAFAGGKTKADRQTAIRIWGMLLVMAGVQGLPFAEYVLSTLDILGTQAKKFFGMENPKVNIRKDIRELLSSITDNPDIIMHGAGRYMGAGPLKLLEMFGAPVPNLDISGSLSMGEPIPGFRMNDLRGNPNEVAGQMLLNGLGPIPNIALGMWDSVSSTDPDVWKRMEKAMPVFAKNISKATRFAMRGEETTRGRATFLPYDGNNPEEAGEIIAQALGFTSTRLSQKRSIYGEQMTTALYWTERRQLLLERYAYAVKTGDVNAKKEAVLSIREFNAGLTNKELKPYKISNANMRNSLRSKLRVLNKRERGLPTTDRDRLIYRSIEESH